LAPAFPSTATSVGDHSLATPGRGTALAASTWTSNRSVSDDGEASSLIRDTAAQLG
jgi:hypothetical protein